MRVMTCLLAILAVTGCEGRPTNQLAVVRDSAGIAIVESTAPAWGDASPWAIAATPALDLATSGSGPAHDFVFVRSVLRLADGRVVVVDEGTDDIRLFDADGIHLRSIGREGQGPGEFRRPISVQPHRGDSLVVWDFWLRRITVLSEDLELGRVANLPDPELHTLRLLTFDDSTFIASLYTLDGAGTQPGFYRLPQDLARISFEELAHDTIATLAGFEGYNYETGDASPPFARASHFAVHQESVVLGDANTMELKTLRTDGSVVRILRVPEFDLSITAEDIEKERFIPEGAPPAYVRLQQEMPVPDTKPAYVGLQVDAVGYTWALQHRSRVDLSQPQIWTIFDPDGRWLGDFATPASFEVLSIGVDHLTGVYRDELDVQHPQVLTLVR